jgi:Na+/H+ antiporter NhaD/arsenite permease-like protein
VTALAIFILVYLGLILGNWPGLALDRTGTALLGAIAFIIVQGMSLVQATGYVDLSAIAILFSFMIISAQFFYSGFYTRIVERIEQWELSPPALLLLVTFIAGALSSVLINDIVCLALAPLIIRGCTRKRLNPVPFLLGLACGSNIGSALTLVGNPQNLLIGQVLHIPFAEYLKYSLVPGLVSLPIAWLLILLQTGQGWYQEPREIEFETTPFDRWQAWKGVGLISLLLISFFFDVPRDHASLVIAGTLLLSRRMASQRMLNFVDWQLLVLFIGLFVVNGGFLATHAFDKLLINLQNYHIDLTAPLWIFLGAAILSNLVSNVPAVMLLLPFVHGSFNGSLLGLSSTLAGNLFIVGSFANLIVIAQAARFGITITWRQHMKVGAPIALITLAITAAWLYLLRP